MKRKISNNSVLDMNINLETSGNIDEFVFTEKYNNVTEVIEH